MENFKVLSQDCRNDISDSVGGSYFVQKKNIIAQFRWGKSGNFGSAADAHAALTQYLLERKDSANLFVNLLEFAN